MFKFFVYLLVFYVIFRYIFNWLFRVKITNYKQYQQPENRHSKPEGTITIFTDNKSKTSTNQHHVPGEYVDFEEIK